MNNKNAKITPKVEKIGDGTADDVIRANIDYVAGAESVQIQVKYWDEIKSYHVKSIEVDADQIAKVFTIFMQNLCANCSPIYRYMESAESYRSKKEGRAGVNGYSGATGVGTDKINQIIQMIAEATNKGESMETIALLRARLNELIDEEVNEINEVKS